MMSNKIMRIANVNNKEKEYLSYTEELKQAKGITIFEMFKQSFTNIIGTKFDNNDPAVQEFLNDCYSMYKDTDNTNTNLFSEVSGTNGADFILYKILQNNKNIELNEVLYTLKDYLQEVHKDDEVFLSYDEIIALSEKFDDFKNINIGLWKELL